MSTTNTSNKYTYTMFASDVIAMLNGETEITADKKSAMIEKARDLYEQQMKKADYNATHKSARTPKGASDETKERANAIKGVLSATPMTTAEINEALGSDFTALQVANSVKYIDGVKTSRVIRSTVNSKGLTAEKEYTAYSL